MAPGFGLRVPAVGTPADTAAYAARVEDAGFDFMWMPDTPLLAGLWRDVHMHLGAAAASTSRLRLGPGVTNPLTRHPLATASALATLADASGGRADLVAGTGYSSAYIIGRKAATRKSMREATTLWRSLFSGAPTVLPGSEATLDPPYADLPIILAASGPAMLALAGEIADGVLIHVGAAPEAVSWAIGRIEDGMKAAGRSRAEVKRIVVVTACNRRRSRLGDRAHAAVRGRAVPPPPRRPAVRRRRRAPGPRGGSPSPTPISATRSTGRRRAAIPPSSPTRRSRPASRSDPRTRSPTAPGPLQPSTSTRSGGGTRPPGPGLTRS